jgi:hypothetical protein
MEFLTFSWEAHYVMNYVKMDIYSVKCIFSRAIVLVFLFFCSGSRIWNHFTSNSLVESPTPVAIIEPVTELLRSPSETPALPLRLIHAKKLM